MKKNVPSVGDYDAICSTQWIQCLSRIQCRQDKASLCEVEEGPFVVALHSYNG